MEGSLKLNRWALLDALHSKFIFAGANCPQNCGQMCGGLRGRDVAGDGMLQIDMNHILGTQTAHGDVSQRSF